MALRASLTSSSLNGLMIASTFFIGFSSLAGLPRRGSYSNTCAAVKSARGISQTVRTLAVLGEIEPHHLFFLGCAQTHRGIDELQQDVGENEGVDDRRHHPDRLDDQLRGIAEQQTVRTRGGRIDQRGGEKAGCQRTPRAADTVYAHDIERVVVAD